MRQRVGSGPRNMTAKLLDCSDLTSANGELFALGIHQVALELPQTQMSIGHSLARVERAPGLDLIVAYDPYSTRDPSNPAIDEGTREELKRLGVVRGRPGIGYPAAVHLDRCGTPARVVVSDSPHIAMLGGLGMLALLASAQQLILAIAEGHLTWPSPRVIQIVMSGRLAPSVGARDITLELLRRDLGQRVSDLAQAGAHAVVLEFSGPGIRWLSIPERSLLCSIAPDVGAAAALVTSDDKTEQYLRDQRRSKAYRQLAPDPGAPCDDVLCIDLAAVVPLVAGRSGEIHAVGDLVNEPVHELVLGGDSTGSLRDLLIAATWFKTKRVSSDVDVAVVPSTRQVLEVMASNGGLAQLLSVGVRLIEPDIRLLDGSMHAAPSNGNSLRSFPCPIRSPAARAGWSMASIDTLCTSAMAGMLQDPRGARKIPRVTCPRELPIDDSMLFDRKPSISLTTLPPAAIAEASCEPCVPPFEPPPLRAFAADLQVQDS